ncbi:DUF397 domain-containing protein [Streptomyces sp. NPDC005808]|uniref:DUF397 domain-containing protein n=1 Tax=Streptomyces sp. NPDC005808 TaxID=3364734 RepID=UPI0036C90288
MTTPDYWQKSSFSGSGDGDNCVELGWQKSSFSGGGEGNDCVELAATTPRTIHFRESDTPATRLTTTPAPLAHLLHGIKSGTLATPTT